MAVYQVPPDISAKEKIVGGILTKEQLITILACISGGVGCYFLLSTFLENTVSIIISCVIFLPLAVIFTFVKINGLPILKFFRLKKKHVRKVQYLKNHRTESDNFTIDYLSMSAREKMQNEKKSKR